MCGSDDNDPVRVLYAIATADRDGGACRVCCGHADAGISMRGRREGMEVWKGVFMCPFVSVNSFLNGETSTFIQQNLSRSHGLARHDIYEWW